MARARGASLARNAIGTPPMLTTVFVVVATGGEGSGDLIADGTRGTLPGLSRSRAANEPRSMMNYERPAIARQEKIAGPVIAGAAPGSNTNLTPKWAPHEKSTDTSHDSD